MKKSLVLVLSIFLVLGVVWGIGQCRHQSDYEAAAEESQTLARQATEQRQAEARQAEEANQEDDNVSSTLPAGVEIPRYESSRGGQIIKHLGYTVSYDADFKTPQWVAWELTADKAQGTEPRASKFQPDPEVRGAQAYTTDYTRSGYDRGHMAPAADMKWSKQAMTESFYLTNVCPQNSNLNRGDWKDLEELEREWAISYGSVSITAGPIYRTKRPKRIGANQVAVPDAFFKVLLIGYPKAPKAYAFIFANVAGSHPLTYYQVTVDEAERQTGMDFFPTLPVKVQERIESVKPSL